MLAPQLSAEIDKGYVVAVFLGERCRDTLPFISA
jgi:hypothetical protein